MFTRDKSYSRAWCDEADLTRVTRWSSCCSSCGDAGSDSGERREVDVIVVVDVVIGRELECRYIHILPIPQTLIRPIWSGDPKTNYYETTTTIAAAAALAAATTTSLSYVRT